MSMLLLGNAVCMCGSIIMVAIGLVKSKKKILLWQCLQFGLLSVGNLLLGGISGCIADAICVVRNLVSLRREFTTPFKLLFIGLQILLTVLFNDMGLIGWLPVLAACIFTWCLDTQNEVLLKLLIILAQIMWAIYDLAIQNYATIVFDVLTVASNLAGICRILAGRRTKESN